MEKKLQFVFNLKTRLLSIISKMHLFGGIMEYEYMYSEDGNVYYMNCKYAGCVYTFIKFNTHIGTFRLYGDNEQFCGEINMKQFCM